MAPQDTPLPLPHENVWDYPRPPALEPVSFPLTVTAGGIPLAASGRAYRVLETSHPPTYYLPPEDVLMDRLVTVPGRSLCEWKGQARYVGLAEGPAAGHPIGWTYDAPTGRFSAIAGYIAFYPGRCDECTVGGHVVIPQEGDFYGGWRTENLSGPFKGGPGTWGW